MVEIEQIEEESKLQLTIAEASDLIFMLTTRIDEAKYAEHKMSVKLGYTVNKNSESDAPQKMQSRLTIEGEHDEEIDGDEDGNDGNTHSQNASHPIIHGQQENQVYCRSIKPPQASLPKFYGSAEEFPEYWAIFETLVHKSRELDIMEKILLLKESLKGRAQSVIKGIRLVPENYEWIIKTLKENYEDNSTNRSQVVQKLTKLRSASNFADNCSAVFDQINVLVNQMVSAGYDVRKSCDPMWCEAILSKFPRDIIKPVLIASKTQRNQTVDNLLGQIKEEIAAKVYVENRLGEHNNSQVTNAADKRSKARPQSGDQNCAFCHKGNHNSFACRTITD